VWYTTPSSTSTSPIEKLRWKFVASSHASHRQNSTALNSESEAGSSRWFEIRVCQTSSVSPGGTK